MKDGDTFILKYQDSVIFRTLNESDCEWAADNLIYAVNNTEHTLSHVLTFIITGTWGDLEDLDNFDDKLLSIMHMYINKTQLDTVMLP